MACFYCDFKGHESQSATGVIAALLKQLVAGVELIPKEIKKAFERSKGKVDGRALRLRNPHYAYQFCLIIATGIYLHRRTRRVSHKTST